MGLTALPHPAPRVQENREGARTYLESVIRLHPIWRMGNYWLTAMEMALGDKGLISPKRCACARAQARERALTRARWQGRIGAERYGRARGLHARSLSL